MADEQKIPPKSKWPTLSSVRLYEIRSNMLDLSYSARQHGASYAAQYAKLVSDLDSLISYKEHEEAEERLREGEEMRRD